ncbi:hypothetical protein IMT09_30425, partial [Burkholderia cepacia]|nr:hypothetical protein [Burkholderia cepacia]
MSRPPVAKWRYNWQPEPGPPEAHMSDLLVPLDSVGDRRPPPPYEQG